MASDPAGITPERVAEMCSTVPSQRWALAAQRDSSGEAAKLVPGILASYEVFLDVVADKEQALQRLHDPQEHRQLRGNAAAFGDQISQLMRHVTTDSQFRRLIV